nr:hypothetical protein [uncultured Actinoplanes sp.]
MEDMDDPAPGEPDAGALPITVGLLTVSLLVQSLVTRHGIHAAENDRDARN